LPFIILFVISIFEGEQKRSEKMPKKERTMLLIKLPYWLGIVADALWAVILLFPSVFALVMGRADFVPDLQFRLVMAIGGILMAGWTILLIWAVQSPIERRFVILLTAILVCGFFVVALVGLLAGTQFNIWILAKTAILFITMVISYFLSGKYSSEIPSGSKL
jgi:hypothetical protein